MSVSFLRVGVSVAVVVSWCLQSLFPWLWFVLSRNWACQRYVFNFIKGFGIYIWFFFSSNRYAKGTFNLPPLPLTPPPTPTPPHPPKKKKKKQISFCYYFLYFDGCYDPQMAKNWKTTGWPKDVALDWSKSTDYFRRIFDLKFCFERYLIASCIEFWCLVVIFWRWIACIWTCSLLRFVHFVNTVSPLFTKNALFENFDKFIMSSRCQITQTSASGSYGAKIVPKK